MFVDDDDGPPFVSVSITGYDHCATSSTVISARNTYYLLYQFGFQNFDSGLSSAAGTLFFIAFAVIAAVFVELSERVAFFDN